MVQAGLEDQELLARVAVADVNALETLYDRYSSLIYSVALFIVRDSPTAEEITQDIFIQIWNKASLYRPEKGKVVSWLTRMARNRSIDLLRRRDIRPEGHSAELGEEMLAYFASDGLGPEQMVETGQQRELIVQAVRQLPREQRRVLALAYFLGCSHQEISALLDEPLGTVKTRLRLAIIKLRNILAPAHFNDEIDPKANNLR